MTTISAGKENVVRIGDYVSFKFPKHQAFLSAEGILVEDVYVSSSTTFFEEHLFQIYTQRQYSATNEYDEYMETNTIEDDESETNQDPAALSYIEALTKGKDNEIVLNRNVMKSKTGNILCFGDTVQLLHVKSNKFLTVKPTDLARDERENMKVTLSYDGSVMSWIKIMPRFKINREGEPITNGAEILLKVSERANEFLHCADRPPPRGKMREVNSSLESPTGWKLNIFQKSEELNKPMNLLAGHFVTIRDPETQCLLAPLSLPINLEAINDPTTLGSLTTNENNSFESPWNISKNMMVDDVSTENSDSDAASETSISSMDEFIRDYGCVVMRPSQENNHDSDAIWMMESKSIAKGGIIKFKSDKIRLRHFNTGKYLCVIQREDIPDDYYFTTIDAPDEKKTLFFLSEIHSNSDYLTNLKAVQIRHAYYGLYLNKGIYHDSQRVYTCSTTRSKSKALSVIMTKYVQMDNFGGVKASLPNETTLDIYFAKACMQHLGKYIKAASMPLIANDSSSIWSRIDPADRALFTLIMARTTLFVQGYPIRLKTGGVEEVSRSKGGKHLILRRQNILREIRLLESLMIMIKSLQPISDMISSNESTNKLAKSPYVVTGKEILSECLNLLHDLIKDNPINQLYIADHLLIILSHVSTDKIAAKIAQELLSSNRELQETKVGVREITIFTEKMRDVHMNSMYLQLLRTCCSCMGQGLPRNQDMVNRILFHKGKDVLIDLNIDFETSFQIDWGIGSKLYDLYISPAKQSNDNILGGKLLSKGIPSIIVSWKINSSRFNPQKLFNKTVVSLSDILPRDQLISIPTQKFSSKNKSGKSTYRTQTISIPDQDDERSALTHFFVSQIFLSGEMCLGRNYPVIQEMEKLYSFDFLLAVLKTCSNNSIKSAVAYLLQQLYIDREPQLETHLPRLTRTITEVQSPNFLEIVKINGTERSNFVILEYLISNHLDEIKFGPFPLHTLNLLGLLHSLIKFNFYGQLDKMHDIVNSIILCLKRDDSDIAVEKDAAKVGDNIEKIRRLSAYGARKPIARPSTSKSSQAVNTNKSNRIVDGSNTIIAHDGNESVSWTEKTEKKIFNFSEYILTHATIWLEIIESVAAHYVMLWFIVATFAFTVFEIYVSGYPWYMQLVEAVIFGIFSLELFLHLLLHIIVRRNPFTFFLEINNMLDIITVALFALVFSANHKLIIFAKFARLLRLAILIRLLYQAKEAARLLQESVADGQFTWVLPMRYLKTNDYTLRTLVKSVQILSSIQTNLDDRQLSVFLKKFSNLKMDNIKNLNETGKQLFDEIILSINSFQITNTEYDDIFIDLLMYHNADLVQATLELLMNHHSSYQNFLDHLNKLQLITSEGDEVLFVRLEKIIFELKRDAETHEIWGKLITASHRATSDLMHKNLNDLIHLSKKLREILSFDETYEPIVFIQNILRNLGCFEVCMKISRLILSIDRDNALDECHMNTKNLAFASNQLIYWFALDNSTNQTLVFSELKFFIKTIDNKIDSHLVITAIFRNNLELMETVPKKYIAEFVELICSSGRFPQYISLMASIINVGDKNVINNQYEIIKLMTSPDNQKKVVQFFVPISHPDYQKKIRLMSHYLNMKDVSINDLPNDLAYHLELMGLLSSCTIGRSGMTTIEAKVQSLFQFVDVIEAMLDPNCLLLAKVRYGLFLFNAMLDVETPLPALKDAACIWKVIIASQDVFTFAKDELRQIEKNGWDAATSNRQKVEYMVVNAMILESYFTAYFDYTIFKPEVGQIAVGVERMTIKEFQANEIIKSLFFKVMSIYEMLSPLLAEEHHNVLYKVLVALNNAAKDKIVGDVENIHENYIRSQREYSAAENRDPSKRLYLDILASINSNEDIKKLSQDQIQNFITKFDSLPWKSHVSNADVRFEPLIESLVHHIRGCVQVIVHGEDTIKFMPENMTKTSLWLLRIFRTMIENLWGMSIYERDDDGGEEQDNAVVDLMRVYNGCGMTEMCLDLISKGIDIALQAEALKLLVGMLFKEGGALDIQKTIHSHLSQPGSDMFFRTVRHILHNLMSWHKWNGVILLADEAEPELPDEIIIVRCLQLMCEGHYGPNQDIMREQPNNHTSINVLDDFVLYLQCLDPIKCKTSTAAELAVSATILEVIQGPCEGNQDYFALNTELIETLNRKIRQHPINDCDENQELELKKSCIDILQALLEGQGHKTAVYERMLSVIHVDVILVLCLGERGLVRLTRPNGKEEEESEESVSLRTESLVLLQMLTDFRPELKKELGMGEDFRELVGDSVACIEVVWRGELQRRFFHIPDICLVLAKSTKDNFIMNVKRASPEDKLYGILEASKDMHREILHQKRLKEYKLDTLFSLTNQDRTVWLNFYIVLIINILFIIFYTANKDDCRNIISNDLSAFCPQVMIPNSIVRWIIFILNILLIIGSFFTLLSSLVVRAPVNFQSYQEKEFGLFHCILYTALDFYTMYYSLYLIIALVGFLYHPTLSFLLLDFITLSPSTQSVLLAVYNPRKQILMTLILTFIIMYIFAMFEFFFFNSPANFTEPTTTVTLGNFYKFILRWGLPNNSPENQMTLVVDNVRIISDVAFFFSCLIMLNILKGITIDTFVELRKALEARMEDTTEKCFICGIEKNTFNRTLDRDAFRQHITIEQNLWNYLYFIIYIWEQDKDDDDGLESFVRRCIEDSDLIWFPMNKAIRLAEHQEKGDVHSLKYRFRQDMNKSESNVMEKMNEFKDQIQRTITRLEKALEYEDDVASRKSRMVTTRQSKSGFHPLSRMNTSSLSMSLLSPGGASRMGTSNLNRPSMLSTASSENRAVSVNGVPLSGRGMSPDDPLNNSVTSNSHGSKAFSNYSSEVMFTSNNNNTTALDADILGQLHMRIVSISGLQIDPKYIKHLSVKITSDYQTISIYPLSELQEVKSWSNVLNKGDKPNTPYSNRNMEKVTSALKGTRSSFVLTSISRSGKSNKDAFDFSKSIAPFAPNAEIDDEFHFDEFNVVKKVQLRFDMFESSPALVHQGALPKFDISNIRVKIQILFHSIPPATDYVSVTQGGSGIAADSQQDQAVYLGGLTVSLMTLLQKAHEGRILETTFSQRQVEIPLPVEEDDDEYLDDEVVSEVESFTLSPEKDGGLNKDGLFVTIPHTSPTKNSKLRPRSTLILPACDDCQISISSIASHKLIQDWNLLRS